MKGSTFAAAYAPKSQAERDAMVLDAAKAGSFVRWPMSVVTIESLGHVYQFVVADDYFAIGEPDDLVRTPVGAPTAQALADLLGFQIPTAKMSDLIWQAAAVRLEPITGGQIGIKIGTADQDSGAAAVKHSKAVDAQKGPREGLTAGHKKDIVISNQLTLAPHPPIPPSTLPFMGWDAVVIYGWQRGQGSPGVGDCSKFPAVAGLCDVQGLSLVHEETYADYSHGLRMVSPVALLDGEGVDLAALLKSPTHAKVLSHEGPMKVTRYGEVKGPPGSKPGGGNPCKGLVEGACAPSSPALGGGSSRAFWWGLGGVAAVTAGAYYGHRKGWW